MRAANKHQENSSNDQIPSLMGARTEAVGVDGYHRELITHVTHSPGKAAASLFTGNDNNANTPRSLHSLARPPEDDDDDYI
uniref:Uncharacterized protein n=1 Tax=Caenorhabditis japonica TaxID=281687 RepID=A0A8R1IGT8_CAEJA